MKAIMSGKRQTNVMTFRIRYFPSLKLKPTFQTHHSPLPFQQQKVETLAATEGVFMASWAQHGTTKTVRTRSATLHHHDGAFTVHRAWHRTTTMPRSPRWRVLLFFFGKFFIDCVKCSKLLAFLFFTVLWIAIISWSGNVWYKKWNFIVNCNY